MSNPSKQDRLEDQPLHHVQRLDLARRIPPTVGVVEPAPDGGTLLRVGAERVEQVVGYLLLLGFDFEVVGPPPARAAAARLAAGIAARHR